MKISQALVFGFAGLSLLMSPVIQPLSAIAQSQSESEESIVSQSHIDEFCEDVESPPEPGIQFNGSSASAAVMQLQPGQYSHPNDAALVLYPNGHFFIRPQVREEEVFGTPAMVRNMRGTAGPDLLLVQSKLIGGCSLEHLSEVMIENDLSVESLTTYYEDTLAEGRPYSLIDVVAYCVQAGAQPQPGIQFDGNEASPIVMNLAPGRYSYPGEGILLVAPSQEFLMWFPEQTTRISLTDGPDLYRNRGVMGCSAEQLSELIARNNLVVDDFEFVDARN